MDGKETTIPAGDISFSIENTIDDFHGSQKLIDDLFETETSTSNPDEIEPIVKEVEPQKKEDKKIPKGKEIVQKEEGESQTPQDTLFNFLGDNTEEETTEEAPEEKAPETTEETQQDVTPFSALTKDLFKLGVFTKEDEEEETEVTTAQEFLERFNAEKRKGAIEVVNNFISQFGEDYRNAFDAIYVKGVNPKDYFGIYNNVVSFAELDMEDENNQTMVIKQALADNGFEAEDIATEVERLKNYGDLESTAARYHKVLVKKEANKLQQLEQQAEQEQKQKQYIKNQYVQNVQSVISEKLKVKEFDGIPINQKLATELQDFLLVDKYKTTSGETLTDFDRTILELKRPENHALKVKVGLLLKILEKDPTLSTIQKTGMSKKSNELFGEVARQVSKVGLNQKENKSSSWFQ